MHNAKKTLHMKKLIFNVLFPLIVIFTTIELNAQNSVYKATPDKIADLINTKLDLDFDFQTKEIFGKAWITLKPHAYSTDSLKLDAKGMIIDNVSLIKKDNEELPLKYSYDNKQLSIKLDKEYVRNEPYTIYITYTSKPDKTQEKGVHFINIDNSDKNTPTEIWTFGQPERNSTWYPTIDRPNQKTTQEISLTVPKKYTTLSNGILTSQKETNNQKRIDTWVLNQPQAPYLTFFAIGDFKVIKDKWKGKEISYYLEPEIASIPDIQDKLFPNTIEAIEYFSDLLELEFPWDKYSQIRLRNYPGGMENTTATAFNEDGKYTAKELADENYLSGHIHELFHQWFGDYVTCESWANTALNESLADFSEILWAEHKFGENVAGEHFQKGLEDYLKNPDGWKIPLIRYDYPDPNYMFNGITYQKGGRIINMLRSYLGDEVFILGLRDYLKSHAFGTAEAADLRISMENASGKDLNWFFNEWFFGAGHPILDISYIWNEQLKETQVIIKQEQEGIKFTLPIFVDIYEQDKKTRKHVWLKSKVDTLVFKTDSKPLLINFDAEKTLITQKSDHKDINEFIYQYFNAPLYLDRYEAVEFAGNNLSNSESQKILYPALNDNSYKIRLKTIKLFDSLKLKPNNLYYTQLEKIALNDKNNLVKALAIQSLGNLKKSKYDYIFENSINAQSYAVQTASILALSNSNPKKALKYAHQFENDSQKELHNAILYIYSQYGGEYEWNYLNDLFKTLPPPKQFNIVKDYGVAISRLDDINEITEGINSIKELGIIAKKHNVEGDIINVLDLIKENSKKKEAKILAENAIKQINESE